MEIQAGSTARAPDPPCTSTGGCFNPENPQEIPPAAAAGPEAAWGGCHPHPAGAFRQGHGSHRSPREPRRSMPATSTQQTPLRAPAGHGCPGERMLGEPHGVAEPEHRHGFPWSPPMEAVGRKTPSGPAPALRGSHHHPGPQHPQPSKATPVPSSAAETAAAQSHRGAPTVPALCHGALPAG